MDRKRALEILGLREDATEEIIVKRYNVLFKKFRYTDTSDLGYTREELDEAYRLLMGFEYRDPVEERRKKARQQKPNPVLKALGIDHDKLSNFIYYYKWTIILGALVLAFVIWIASSLANRVDPDFKLVIAGEIYVEDIEAFESALSTVISTEEPQAQHVLISDRMDPRPCQLTSRNFRWKSWSGKMTSLSLTWPCTTGWRLSPSLCLCMTGWMNWEARPMTKAWLSRFRERMK